MVLEEFLPLVGSWLLADCEPELVKIKLVEASPFRPNSTVPRPPFILVFHTGPDIRLQEGTYAMRCDGFGPDLVYISDMLPPIGAEPGFYYQSNFN
jgi:hypothetical protein